jgi:hypothetical protein
MVAVFTAGVFISSCKKNDEDPVLSITSFSPSSGNAGTVVTINGTAFDATLANNTVKFGDITATVNAVTSTALVVTVPAGAANGAQKISVTVGGKTVTSASDFTVSSFPEVTLKDSVNAGASGTTTFNWTADKRYLLDGFVYVPKGVTLNIAAGTIIKGKNFNAALVVEPGATINAEGTATNPIIFTSSLPAGQRGYGDWGGVVIAGNAVVNLTAPLTAEGGIRTKYGSNDVAKNTESSGKFRYVRIEYSGYAVQPNSELNGLTLAGVGSGTTIDHVQVSFINDDGFEWFGGAVNMKYIIAHRVIDDDFDTDNSYSGNLQFGIGTRDNTAADNVSGSKGFESDNSGTSPFTQTPKTSATFSNFTLTGPCYTYSSGNQSLGSGTTAVSPSFVSAIHLRRATSLSIYNSVIVGWNAGLLVDNINTAANAKSGDLVVKNNVFAGINKNTVNGVANSRKEMLYIATQQGGNQTPTNLVSPLAAETGAAADTANAFGTGVGPNQWFNANGNKRVDDGTSVLESPFAASAGSITTPNFLFKSTFTPPAATFTDSKVSGSFFNKVTFVGAVSTGSDNWATESWIEWNPQAKAY